MNSKKMIAGVLSLLILTGIITVSVRGCGGSTTATDPLTAAKQRIAELQKENAELKNPPAPKPETGKISSEIAKIRATFRGRVPAEKAETEPTENLEAEFDKVVEKAKDEKVEKSNKIDSLQEDIRVITDKLNSANFDLKLCNEAIRHAPNRFVALQAEKDKNTNEITLARLKEQLRKKVAELKALE